jgi:DNA-binding MarR family transcriptional regulator
MSQDEGFASGWEVIIAVRRFQHRLEVFMDQSLEPLGMNFAQYRALEFLDTNLEMHVPELARSLRVSRQAALATVAKLDRGGLIDLTREAGRRYVRPSDLGRHRLRRCKRFTADIKQHLEQELTPDERRRLAELLRRADRCLIAPSRPEWWLAP